MSEDTKNNLFPPDPPAASEPTPLSSRRRLLRTGLAATPVLMTLFARPILAQTCTTPSGYVSANASHPGASVCTGLTPFSWASTPSQGWPIPPTTLFGSQFSPSSGMNLGSIGSQTLLAVVQNNGNSGNPTTNKLAMFIVAAYLNALRPGSTPPLSPAVVRDMWSEYASSGAGALGTFSPSAGASWNVNEIFDYLMTTM